MKDDLVHLIADLSSECVRAKLRLLDVMRRNDAMTSELIYQLFRDGTLAKLYDLDKQARRVASCGDMLLRHERIVDHWSYGSRNTDLGDGLYMVVLTERDLNLMSRTYLKEGIAILKGQLTLIRKLMDEYETLTLLVAITDATLNFDKED